MVLSKEEGASVGDGGVNADRVFNSDLSWRLW